jgi:zinc-ribbon domain
MDIGSLFLILALCIPVVLFIARPLLERNNMPASQNEEDLSNLLAQRDQIVATLQELDDDYSLGKIPQDEYPSQRMSLLQSGAEILKQIDTFQSSGTSIAHEDRLETAVAARRLSQDGSLAPSRKNGNAVPPVPDDELEQRIALRRRLMQEKAGGFCPKCGKPVHVSDHFCPKCGAVLA